MRRKKDWYFFAEQPATAPHPAHPEGCAALRIVLVTVARVSRSCEHFPDVFDPHLLLRDETIQALPTMIVSTHNNPVVPPVVICAVRDQTMQALQGYLAHKKPRTLQEGYA